LTISACSRILSKGDVIKLYKKGILIPLSHLNDVDSCVMPGLDFVKSFYLTGTYRQHGKKVTRIYGSLAQEEQTQALSIRRRKNWIMLQETRV
jgi:hypothetical protein